MNRYRVIISVESGELEPVEFRSFDVAARYVDQCARDMPGYRDHLIETVEPVEEAA
jgi:hypothetical protein